jgi:ketosteroid isomerase-like protein
MEYSTTSQQAVEVAQAYLDRWPDDFAGAMRDLLASDIVYCLNVDREALHIGGETVGWSAVNAKMLELRAMFDYLVFRPRLLSAQGNVVRYRIEFLLRHCASQEILSFSLRCVVTVRDRHITRIDEYVDAPQIETFMRLRELDRAAASPGQ